MTTTYTLPQPITPRPPRWTAAPASPASPELRAADFHRLGKLAVDQGNHVQAYACFLSAAALTFGDVSRKLDLLRLSREAYHRFELSQLGNVGLSSFTDTMEPQ